MPAVYTEFLDDTSQERDSSMKFDIDEAVELVRGSQLISGDVRGAIKTVVAALNDQVVDMDELKSKETKQKSIVRKEWDKLRDFHNKSASPSSELKQLEKYKAELENLRRIRVMIEEAEESKQDKIKLA